MKVNLQDVASIDNFQNTLKLGITFKHLHGFTKKVRLMVHKCFTFGFRDFKSNIYFVHGFISHRLHF